MGEGGFLRDWLLFILFSLGFGGHMCLAIDFCWYSCIIQGCEEGQSLTNMVMLTQVPAVVLLLIILALLQHF